MLVFINLPLVASGSAVARAVSSSCFPEDRHLLCIGVYPLNNAPFDVSADGDLRVVGYCW